MTRSAWEQLLAGQPWFRCQGKFPLPAYSEFMPPPRFGPSPYGAANPTPRPDDDPLGWIVSEYEETLELRPGLHSIARQVLESLVRLGRGHATHGISKYKLTDNPYWPKVLSERAGSVPHERYVVLMPLALSRTQDDKGRIRWTLFGGSDQGPSCAFWRSFYSAPAKELAAEASLDLIRRILSAAYRVPRETLRDMRRAGFRVLPDGKEAKPLVPEWREGTLPRWTRDLLYSADEPLKRVRYLLTFRPFGSLPATVQRAYLAGALHLIPFPGSLFPWGVPSFWRMRRELPLATQIPLLHLIARHEGVHGIRVPQSGWLHEPRPDRPHPDERYGPIRETFRRTHRFSRARRDASHDEIVSAQEDRMAHVLFSASAADMGLYNKPMARNAQIWTDSFETVLDGPRSTRDQIEPAAKRVRAGGTFGYRFQFPAMRVGLHEIYWHRPLVAWLGESGNEPNLMPDGPLGYLTAYQADHPDPARAIELQPRLLQREPQQASLEIFPPATDARPLQTVGNIRKLLDTQALLGGRSLPESFARALVTAPKDVARPEWLESLPAKSSDPARAGSLVDRLRMPGAAISAPDDDAGTDSLTFDQTATRAFEVAYWKAIARLSRGRFPNRNNADTARDPMTQATVAHPGRDLRRVGDQLLAGYQKVIAGAGMEGRAEVGDLPFHWRTDFDFAWSNGWLESQGSQPGERDLIVVIPGRDRRRAVIMADHYDTAFMEDCYEVTRSGTGARLAAPGADDNGSATAALQVAAGPLLRLGRERRLGCDVWLVHLTGEEFPADCLGARHLARSLVEGTLAMRRADGRRRDLSAVRVQGVFVLDMVAHNNPKNLDVFQIAPGASREAMELAMQAHVATECWNRSAEAWNRQGIRRGRGRGERSSDPRRIPQVARHPRMWGEVRPHYARRSTLFNTDGQIFSDAGIPVVLFMEDYDIDRKGYHDTEDTMSNIDLDYGSALAAIAIESVARATLLG